MMGTFWKILSGISSLIIIGCAAIGLFKIGFGLRFNLTPSEPRGIYVMVPVSERPLRGNLVTFCLDYDNPYSALAATRGYLGDGSCSSGLKPLLKRLGGLPGDKLEVTPDGIIVNGSFLAGTARPDFDSQGRAMPAPLLEDGEIPEGMALVISQRLSNSFDSRFFGLVPYDSLSQVTPVLTKKEITPDVVSD
jgi:conjugative transfer signal peptidase TraF